MLSQIYILRDCINVLVNLGVQTGCGDRSGLQSRVYIYIYIQ